MKDGPDWKRRAIGSAKAFSAAMALSAILGLGLRIFVGPGVTPPYIVSLCSNCLSAAALALYWDDITALHRE